VLGPNGVSRDLNRARRHFGASGFAEFYCHESSILQLKVQTTTMDADVFSFLFTEDAMEENIKRGL